MGLETVAFSIAGSHKGFWCSSHCADWLLLQRSVSRQAWCTRASSTLLLGEWVHALTCRHHSVSVVLADVWTRRYTGLSGPKESEHCPAAIVHWLQPPGAPSSRRRAYGVIRAATGDSSTLVFRLGLWNSNCYLGTAHVVASVAGGFVVSAV